MILCTRFRLMITAALVALACTPAARAQLWTFKGVVATGEQPDAAVGPDGRIHLVTSRYYQFDANGNLLVDEPSPAPDQGQGAMDFNPAIAVDGSGTAHLVTRRNGSWGGGYELWYAKRTAAGAWSSYRATTPVPRNYQVAVAAAGGGYVYLTHSSSSGGEVWGPVKFYREAGGTMRALGEIANVARIDCDQLIRSRGADLYFASGKCDTSGRSYFSRTAATDNPVAALNAAMTSHDAGSGRRGFPATAIDAQGRHHVAYGAAGTIHYNKYGVVNTKVFDTDRQVFAGLGSWHLGVGLCSLAVSEDGQRVLIIALNPDGSNQTGSRSEMRYSFSLDGGATWRAPASMGRYTTAGEGRSRPAIVVLRDKAFIFYKDNAARGTSLAILQARRTTTTSDTRTVLEPVESDADYARWSDARLPAEAITRAPKADPDEDGASNRDEFLADTDPADPESRLAVHAIDAQTAVHLRFDSSPNRSYTLQYLAETDVGEWRDVPGCRPVQGTGAVLSLSDPHPTDARLYRIRTSRPP